MKPEELLYSLDYVGDDLLSQAEQGVLVRRKHGWARIAAAAVLAVAVGTAGFLLLRSSLHGRSEPQGSGLPTATVPEPQTLSPIPVGSNYKESFLRTVDEGCLELQGDTWTGAPALTRLPVFENNLSYTGDPEAEGRPCQYDQAQLRAMLEQAAARLGLAAPEKVSILMDEFGAEQFPPMLQAETEQGTLAVYGDGRVLMLYDDAHKLCATVKPELEAGLTEEQAETAWKQASMQDCGEKVQALLGLSGCRLALWDHWDCFSSGYHSCMLFPEREDPAEQLLARYFEGVWLLTVDGRNVCGLQWYCSPDSNGGPARPEWLTPLGDYPIITPEAARRSLLSGAYLGMARLGDGLTEAEVGTPELVYLTERYHELLLPFYRFMLPAGSSHLTEQSTDYTLVYVPAVDPAYLTDFPTTQASSARVELQGSSQLRGPAGTVDALLFLGGGCQDPVWADLDGDGQTELIYWCYGPTSGLYTVGLCVYGLEEGWPVLEAAQIYNCVEGRAIHLSAEGDSVYLHRNSEAGDAAVTEVQIFSLTIEDGTLLLNGEIQQKSFQLWGTQSLYLFGRSFGELKRSSSKVLLSTDACIILELPETDSDPERSGYAVALTDNGVTVTALLRYEPNYLQDWFCAQSGVSPIKAPADPAALVGQTVEALTERFGPCHTVLEEGELLCWFTEDCQMLTVRGSDTVTDARLTELTALGD